MAQNGEQDARLEPFGRPLAQWVRFDRYEIRDGVIRPARDARPQPYDPWQDYATARSGWGGGGGATPYESLLELVWSVRLRPGRLGESARLEARSEHAILDWCATHGLLGIAPHVAEVTYLAPRWAETPGSRAARLGLVPVQRRYAWGSEGWQVREHVSSPVDDPRIASAPKRDGTLVPRRLWSPAWEMPVVLGRDLGSGTWVTTTVGDAWGPYFPDVPARDRATYAYPVPLSEEFWTGYGEPVEDFLAVTTFYAKTLEDLAPEPREGETLLDYAPRIAEAQTALFSLIAGVHPTLDVTDDARWARAWRAKSLLAAYAMMAYLDITDGKRILACEVCGKPFVSGAYQARYCSARCRKAATQRAYRSRHRQDSDTRSATGRGSGDAMTSAEEPGRQTDR